jgi:methylglyoxal synthase
MMEKADMVQFLNKNSDLLQQESIKLIATELQEVRLRKPVKVKKMLSGPMEEMRKLRRE